MTSSVFRVGRVAAPSRAAAPRAAGARHRAPEVPGRFEVVTDPRDLLRVGRHAEPEWHRAQFDPARDGDALDWLGFTTGTGATSS